MKELHSGHRSRIDTKARLMGLEFLEEHEQLEKLLFAVIPRGNTNEIAIKLINEFGSIYGVLCADVEQLRAVDGVGTRTAEFLHDMMPLLGIVERAAMQSNSKRITLDTTEKIGEYAKQFFYGKLVENLYMISLNSANEVMRFDKISEGTATAASVSMHIIAKRAILNEASAVILMHNHPGGRLEPSMADITMTRDVKEALSSLGISLIDHIIVACGKWISMNEGNRR